MKSGRKIMLMLLLFELTLVGNCFARGIPTPSEAVSSILVGIGIILLLCCMAFNVSWWLYGRTLSEDYPVFVVVVIMFTTLIGFFLGFNFLFGAIFSRLFPSTWGYFTDYDNFIPYSRDAAYYLSGLFTIGMAVLLYKDEGKISDNKWVKDEDKKIIDKWQDTPD